MAEDFEVGDSNAVRDEEEDGVKYTALRGNMERRMPVWITLTSSDDKKLALNMSLAQRLTALSNGNTRVHFGGGDATDAKESIEKVLQAIATNR
jgi:hypothetical protein